MQEFTICNETFTIEKVTEYNNRVWAQTHNIHDLFRIPRAPGTNRKTGYVASWKDSHHWARTSNQAFKNLLHGLNWVLVKTPNSYILMRRGEE